MQRREGYGRQNVTMNRARGFLLEELNRLGASNIVISSNLSLRLDGLPRAGQRRPDDTGVVVYFTLKKDQKCFPCDKWNRVEDNIYAVGKTIEALRGIERWGSKQMVDATFNGFRALPDPDNKPWYSVLGVDPRASQKEIMRAYRRLAKEHHPDCGGDPGEFDRVRKACQEGLRRAL